MVKNLLFDLGGVIMDIRRENCIESLKRLGMEDPGMFLGEYVQAGPFGDLESGKITPAEFRDELRKWLPEGVTDGQIDSAFEDFLIGIPLHRLHELEELRKRYKIYLLSNTNPIMWNDRIAKEFEKDGKTIGDYFDGMVTSFESKCMKPDAKIFEDVVEKCGIKPEETIFLDDSATNTEAASRLGFQTITVTPGSEFAELLSESNS